jgi:hypothetical protein
MEMKAARAQDGSSQLAVKDAIFARSGIYLYSRKEIEAWGIKPKEDKPLYRVYRPAGVLVAAKDKFALVPFCREHPAVDVTPDNFHEYASGVTGGPVEAVTLEDGEIGLRGSVAFFTRDAYDFYMAGNREISVGYVHHLREVRDADRVGYDLIMESIDSVNHACVVPRGRGGAGVRVLDSMQGAIKNTGGVKMMNGFLAFLGIGKAKDENFKLSQVLLDSVAKVHTLDQEGIDREVAGVMAHVNALGDSGAKELLLGAVTDCFKHPVEVIAQKDKVGGKIDELYGKCRAADAEAVQRILDSDGAGDGEDGGEDKKKDPDDEDKDKKKGAKDAAPKDFAGAIDAAVQKAVAAVKDSFEAKIDESVRKALGLDEDKNRKPAADERTTGAAADSAGEASGGDGSFLVRGMFGNR